MIIIKLEQELSSSMRIMIYCINNKHSALFREGGVAESCLSLIRLDFTDFLILKIKGK